MNTPGLDCEDSIAHGERIDALRGYNLIIDEVIIEVNQVWMDLYGYKPEEINYGYCDTFARDIKDLVPEVSICTHKSKLGVHCFIVYYSRFYDSESPKGVGRILDLPFYKRRYYGGENRENMVCDSTAEQQMVRL